MDIHISMVNDFVQSARMQNGYGCFQGIETASNLAQKLSKNAARGFERYKIAPPLFFQCLHEIGVLNPTLIPKCGVSMDVTKKILKAAGVWERLPKNLYSDFKLYLQSGCQQHLWRRGEEMVKLFNLKKIG
jgi:hypothetical protein